MNLIWWIYLVWLDSFSLPNKSTRLWYFVDVETETHWDWEISWMSRLRLIKTGKFNGCRDRDWSRLGKRCRYRDSIETLADLCEQVMTKFWTCYMEAMNTSLTCHVQDIKAWTRREVKNRSLTRNVHDLFTSWSWLLQELLGAVHLLRHTSYYFGLFWTPPPLYHIATCMKIKQKKRLTIKLK